MVAMCFDHSKSLLRVTPKYLASMTCCCLPTPMTLASGGSPMFPLVVHQPAVQSLRRGLSTNRRGLSTNPGVTMWCICGCRDDVSCVWMLQMGHSGDGCVFTSTLCKYDLRKGDLFVLSWARVRRVRRGSLSSELYCLPSTMTLCFLFFRKL